MSEFDLDGFRREIGHRIRSARRALPGWRTQGWLAEQVGVGRATLANLENGRQRVYVDLLWRIAVVLKVPITRLIPDRLTPQEDE